MQHNTNTQKTPSISDYNWLKKSADNSTSALSTPGAADLTQCDAARSTGSGLRRAAGLGWSLRAAPHTAAAPPGHLPQHRNGRLGAPLHGSVGQRPALYGRTDATKALVIAGQGLYGRVRRLGHGVSGQRDLQRLFHAVGATAHVARTQVSGRQTEERRRCMEECQSSPSH